MRGLFVHPSQVADILRRHPELGRARLVITGTTGAETMTLHVEAGQLDDAHARRLADSVRDVTKLRADIAPARPGSLPNDGKVIEDLRRYD